jgi:Flp pilus assembly protein TadG
MTNRNEVPMTRHLHHIRHDERGMSLIIVGMGMMAFMAAGMLAVDVGMLMTARGQAQNAADAGALAGVIGVALNNDTVHAPSGPAVTGAIAAAKSNAVMRGEVSVEPADVEFLNDVNGQPNRVRVTVRRTAGTNNPVTTFMAGIFGHPTADVGATATAEAALANAMTCVKPFMIPDKWRESQSPPWDTSDTFDMYNNHDVLLANPDVYVPATDRYGYTGYTTQNDTGKVLVLRAGTGTNINPSFYFSWKMPGSEIGGDFYRENIAHCNQSIVRWGTPIIQEPGDKTGPTIQGIEELIARDPNAYWDTGCSCVKGSNVGTSPRVFPIPLYDPEFYASGKANGRPADFRVANFLGFFADHIQGNQIYGRITQIVGLVDPNAGPGPENAMPMAIRLIQ